MIDWPTMCRAWSEAMNTTAAAISSGSAMTAVRSREIQGQFVDLATIVRQGLLHSSPCPAGANSVHPDAQARHLEGRAPRESQDRVLAGDVGANAGRADVTARRTGIDDHAGLLCLHYRQHVLQPEEDTTHVDGHHAVEILFRVLGNWLNHALDTGVICEHVDATEGCNGVSHVVLAPGPRPSRRRQ